MQPRHIVISLFLFMMIPASEVAAQTFNPYSYRGRFGIGFAAETLTRFVPDTVSLSLVGKYHANDNLAFQGKLGVCPFLPSTPCMGVDMVLQSLVYEDDRMEVNSTFGVGVTAGFILSQDTPVDTPPPQLVYGAGYIGASVQSKIRPVDFSVDIGPASMHAGTYTGVSARISFAVRSYF